MKAQADFAASRAQTCRDYDKEEVHGFCALRLAEARDLALQARLADAREELEKTKAEKARKQAERDKRAGQDGQERGEGPCRPGRRRARSGRRAGSGAAAGRAGAAAKVVAVLKLSRKSVASAFRKSCLGYPFVKP